MSIKTYAPGEVVLTLGGNIISGYADGTMIVVERASDAMTKVVGADGEVSRTKSADLSGQMTITLKATSNSNAIIGQFAQDDEDSSDGIFPAILKDNLGHVIFATQGWVRKLPNMEFAKEESNREWVVDLAKVTFEWPTTELPA